MKTFGEIKPENRIELPDFEVWTLGFVLLFIVLVSVSHFRSKQSKVDTVSDLRLRYDFAFGTLAITIFYVLLMGLGILPFIWATILFVVITGLFLTGLDKRKWLSILEVALLMSFGLHFVFTQLFTIDLP